MPLPTSHLPRLSIVLAGVTCAVVIAGCGSSGPKSSASSSPYGPPSSPAAMSRCMRANGVSNFPDPVASAGGVGFPGGVVSSPGSDTLTVDGVGFSGPAFQSASKKCKEYLPPGGSGPAISESQKLAAIANAECMRRHGVPVPDPTFPAHGGIAINLGPGVNPSSPAFQSAAKACGGIALRIGARRG